MSDLPAPSPAAFRSAGVPGDCGGDSEIADRAARIGSP